MGRRKIKIERISETRTRNVTFHKRKMGVMKKSYELATLCGADVALLVMYDGKLSQYSSMDLDKFIAKFVQHRMAKPVDVRTNREFANLCSKGGGDQDFEDFEEADEQQALSAGSSGMAPQASMMGTSGMMGTPIIAPTGMDPQQGFVPPQPALAMAPPHHQSSQAALQQASPQSAHLATPGGFIQSQEGHQFVSSQLQAANAPFEQAPHQQPHQQPQSMLQSPASFSAPNLPLPPPLNMQCLPSNTMDGQNSASMSPFTGPHGPQMSSMVTLAQGSHTAVTSLSNSVHHTPSHGNTPVVGPINLTHAPPPPQLPIEHASIMAARRRSSNGSSLRMATPPMTPPTPPSRRNTASAFPPLRIEVPGAAQPQQQQQQSHPQYQKDQAIAPPPPPQVVHPGHHLQHAVSHDSVGSVAVHPASTSLFAPSLFSPNTASLFQSLSEAATVADM